MLTKCRAAGDSTPQQPLFLKVSIPEGQQEPLDRGQVLLDIVDTVEAGPGFRYPVHHEYCQGWELSRLLRVLGLG